MDVHPLQKGAIGYALWPFMVGIPPLRYARFFGFLPAYGGIAGLPLCPPGRLGPGGGDGRFVWGTQKTLKGEQHKHVYVYIYIHICLAVQWIWISITKPH